MCFVFRSDQEDSADRSYRFLESHSHFGCCCWRLPLTQCTPQPASLQSDGCVFVNTSHEDDPIQFRLVLHNYIIRTNTQRNQLLGLDFTSHFYILLVMSFWLEKQETVLPRKRGRKRYCLPLGHKQLETSNTLQVFNWTKSWTGINGSELILLNKISVCYWV